MKIIEKSYKWNGSLSKRSKTEYIIIHHAAATKCSADDIHKIHLGNGWTGIGYHFYVTKSGEVFTGRPIDTVGAHTSNYNSVGIGVCFEGNFENESMTKTQIEAGQELIGYLKGIYPKAKIKKHRDFNATACPGKNFPFDKLCEKRELENISDIVGELNKRNIMTNMALWNVKLGADINACHLARKIANMTVNKERSTKLETVNDIVWELNHRGIITDSKLWLKLFEEDNDLYWLGFKAANYTSNRKGM